MSQQLSLDRMWSSAGAGAGMRRSPSSDVFSRGAGRKPKSAYALARHRSRSRSRASHSNPEWGGDAGDGVDVAAASVADEGGRVSVASSHAIEGLTFLPKTHHHPWLEREFNLYVVEKEYGPAKKFAALHKNEMKTERVETAPVTAPYAGVWEVTDDALWRFTPFSKWTDTLQAELQSDVETIVAAVKEECDVHAQLIDEATDKEDEKMRKAVFAAWKKALLQAQSALTNVTSVVPVRHIAVVAAGMLEDAEFFLQLDARRDILSFQNGVVFLNSATAPVSEEGEQILMRRRLPEDCLSYCLPYYFDHEADQSDMKTFVAAVMSDADARRALQTHVGYWATGATTEKRFYQLSTLPNSGKTTFLEIITAALGAYVSNGRVPIGELMKSSEFEDTLSSELSKRPRPRAFLFDETTRACELKEAFLNLATSGSANIRLSCRIKHRLAEAVHSLQGKFVFSSNHALIIKSSSTGTAFRNTSPPFDAQFVPVDVYGSAPHPPHVKPRDDALCERLKSDAGRCGVMAWIVKGAIRFYSEGIVRCTAWERCAARLLVKGDVHLKWVSEHYTPTGVVGDRVSLQILVEGFTHGARGQRVHDVEDGIRAAFASMNDVVMETEWEDGPSFGGVPGPSVLVQGFTGLRAKRLHDLSFFDSVESARAARAASREADVEIN